MPRKKQNKQQPPKKGRSKTNKFSQQGIGSNVIDTVANTVKGIGRGMLPGLFSTTMATAPNNVGIVAPRALFRVSNGAQRVAEFDPDRSVRITGCGLFADALARVQAQSIYPFAVTGVNPFPAWRGVTPMSIDPRMMQIAVTYQYYAFRTIRWTYIPSTGTSGPVSMVNLALGVSQDAQEYVDLPTPSMVQMLEQNNSILTPAWTPTTISYEHHGTRVWMTNPNAEGTIDESTQCLLGGVLSANSVTAEGNTGPIGQLYVEYVCDLYEPQPVDGDGNYTVALPFTTDPGTGNITPTAVTSPDMYPPGYNPFVNFPPTIAPFSGLVAEEAKFSDAEVQSGNLLRHKFTQGARSTRKLGKSTVPLAQLPVPNSWGAELAELRGLVVKQTQRLDQLGSALGPAV